MKSLTGAALCAVDWIASVLTAGMVAVIFLQVVNRYVFNSPIAWTEEVARFLFVWLSFLGAFLAIRANAHINITAVLKRFTPGTQTMVSAVVTFLLAAYMLTLCWVGWTVALETRATFSAALEMSFFTCTPRFPWGPG